MIPPVTLRDIVGGEEDMGEGKTRRTRKSDLHMNSALNVLEEENEQLNYNSTSTYYDVFLSLPERKKKEKS